MDGPMQRNVLALIIGYSFWGTTGVGVAAAIILAVLILLDVRRAW